MAMKMKSIEYGAPTIQILATPDHYVAFGYKHAKGTSGTPGLSVLEEGRYIVKAGTIYPANDATAIGVILNDYDVTDGDAMMAVVVHGFVKVAALPEVPSSAAVSAMQQIAFVPLTGMGITLTGNKAAIEVGSVAAITPVAFTLSGAKFRDKTETEKLANWTITGESTTKVTVTAITLAADMKTVTFALEQTTAAVAGSVTVVPDADLTNTGKAPSVATIATVAAA